jgi:drug/metabolite transporter (DMT)-like permease
MSNGASASETSAPPSPKVLAALAAVYVIWSTTYLAIRVAVHSLPPFLTAGVRYLAAGLVLMAWARVRGEKMPAAKTWLSSAIVALLFFVVGNGFVALASVHIGSGVVAVVCAMMPLWGAVMLPLVAAGGVRGADATQLRRPGDAPGTPVVVGERTSGREWVGLAIGFAGVLVLALGDDLRADPVAGGLLMLAPIGWAFGSLLVKKLDVGRGLMGSAMQMVAGGALTLLVSLVRGERIPTHVPAEAIFAVVYLATLGSLVGLTAYNYLLVHARPALAMSYAYVNPVLAVFVGAALGGETISPRVGLAIVLILPAVVTIVARPRRSAAPAQGDAPSSGSIIAVKRS